MAEWHIVEGGSLARLLVPPAAVHALRSPSTFAKIEAHAAHSLTGHGRRLYAILADKKRLGRPHWTFTLSELRTLMGVEAQKSYDRWSDFRTRVLDPALAAINDFGTVNVKMKIEKRGRSVSAVRFDWHWKDVHEAADTVLENDRHSKARRKKQDTDGAPPMIEDPKEAAQKWWDSLSSEDQDLWADRIGRESEIGGEMRPRPTRIIRELAFSTYQQLEA
ncbi:replication initiation protein [Pseudooceanicola sp. HF7]|nr:replication initiation protein [Pseudooceanicola sp. HF7]